MNETTFAMIKPDGVENKHIGDIIKRFENADLKIEFISMKTLSKEECTRHYEQHKDKPFFNDLLTYMTSGPVVGMLLSGKDALTKVRTLAGATDPSKAEPGTIRHYFAKSVDRNIIHTSDSPEAVINEFNNLFGLDKASTDSLKTTSIKVLLKEHTQHIKELYENAQQLPNNDVLINSILKDIAKNNRGEVC